MPTAINTTVLIHLYEPPKAIAAGERTGAAFRGYHKTRVKNRDTKEYEDHFTSVSGTVWGKEAEWLSRDGVKGSMVIASGSAYVEKWQTDKGAGAGLRIENATARIVDRKETEPAAETEREAPAPQRGPARPRPAPGLDTTDQPPF